MTGLEKMRRDNNTGRSIFIDIKKQSSEFNVSNRLYAIGKTDVLFFPYNFYFHRGLIVLPLLHTTICPEIQPEASDNKKHAVSATSSGRYTLSVGLIGR